MFQPHHAFVCASAGAPEAELLLASGLIEGSPNIHPGQGTASRRFFFESGFLELLYVHDETEARSDCTSPTRLWDRWLGRGSRANPFGICLSSPRGIDGALPFASWSYRPSYLPAGRYLSFVDQLPISEPEIFFLSWPEVHAPLPGEPTTHPLGLRCMRAVSVGVPDLSSISGSLGAMRDAGYVMVHRSNAPELLIEFSSEEEVSLGIPALGLSIVGRPCSAA